MLWSIWRSHESNSKFTIEGLNLLNLDLTSEIQRENANPEREKVSPILHLNAALGSPFDFQARSSNF